jgi:tetratricopeptide (TPR) repeat protein
MRLIKHLTLNFILLITFSFKFLLPVEAAEKRCDQWVSKAVSVQGIVEVRKTGETNWEPVKLNDTFCGGDMMRVQQNSRAAVVLSNETNIRLDQKTTITFAEIRQDKSFLLDLFTGAAYFFSRFPKSIEVLTPFVNASVEGTEFYIKVESDQAFLSIFEGKIAASNKIGSLSLARGQSATARAGQPPRPVVIINPRDAVQWALYYPPIINWQQKDFTGGGETDWQGMVRNSIGYYWKGDLTGALSAIARAPKEIIDPRFYLYHAALLISVGRVDEAQEDVSTALKLDPLNTYALALQSIVSLVHNKKKQALDLAQKTVDLNPESSTAWVALSFAQQSHFDLQAALTSIEKAVKLDPDNALAWAQLAQLQLSIGELDKSADAAKNAVTLNPDLARTQTILGFSYITRIKIKEAKDTFQRAIELDSSAPLPRLGLGLALIRGGDLKEGRAEIEIAASLDANNSLIRSYLGKAYFDEKRIKPSANQYMVAKELDPLDPTPWFYDAILKQTTNRPIEALQDMQKSIELNDNRAVYRSRLQLDQDLAARSASLGRIYNDLGFQMLGLVEGWKSVNLDPANYSAHRFLADSYAALPRHEIARINELYQSQLLQPLNVTPVQPQLAENSLFILEGAGPSDPSFNDFNPLFLRNRLALQASGVAGENHTLGGEIAQSGVWNNFSYNLGLLHYETDGFRDNNDQHQDLFNTFVQVSLSPNTSILGEYRYSDGEKGDLELTFTESFIPSLRQKEDVHELWFGLRHAFTPKSQLLTSFIYQDADLSADVIPGFFELSSDIDNYIGEMRYLYSSTRWNITGGIGYRDKHEKEEDLGFPTENFDTRFTNVYAYANIDFPKNVSLTIGASGDFLDGATADEDRNQFNPKFGLIWNPVPSTTVRAAAFRTLQRPRISQTQIDPSLEPTQVAGFNQFFLDAEGDDVWRYGIAVDQKFPYSIYGGAELSYRDLKAVILDDSGPTQVVRRRDWDERQARAYLYWTPNSWLALNAEYLYEHFKRDAPDNFAGVEDFKELRTYRFPFGARFAHPSGFSAGFQATYVYQDGDFIVEDFFGPEVVEGDDSFWVVDASVEYRLPKRYGLITLQVKNLFDNQFHFQDTDPGNPRIQPGRLILAKINLSF